jgi:hypothetical protein
LAADAIVAGDGGDGLPAQPGGRPCAARPVGRKGERCCRPTRSFMP